VIRQVPDARRLFLALTFLAVTLLGSNALAQRPAPPRVALFWLESSAEPSYVAAFREALHGLGWLQDGRDLAIVIASAPSYDGMKAAAEALVRTGPAVIVTYGGTATVAVAKATSSVPVVMITSSDPLKLGVVSSLARPGRNVTGYALIGRDLFAKRLDMLKEAVPGLQRVAALYSLDSSSEAAAMQNWIAEARKLQITLEPVGLRAAADFDTVLPGLKGRGFDAVITAPSTLLNGNRTKLIGAVNMARLPAIYTGPEFCQAGGVLCYGASNADGFKRAATYVDKILRGANPGELPVEQASRVSLIVNAAAARRLELKLPDSLLMRADEVLR
jgi:putative ABC transport system substrate-binding protein